AEYYMCSIGEVYKSAIPSALLLESETIILKNRETEALKSELSDDEFLVYEALEKQNSLKVQDIIAILNKKRFCLFYRNYWLKKLFIYRKKSKRITSLNSFGLFVYTKNTTTKTDSKSFWKP